MAISIPGTFSKTVADLLARNPDTQLDLVRSADCRHESAGLLRSSSPASLFPDASNAEAAVSGLLLLLGCWEESHNLSQDIASPDGSYWHAIAHRLEPDASNAGYWFRRVGEHPIFAALHRDAARILQVQGIPGWHLRPAWDPFVFIEWCEEARIEKDAAKKQAALEIQTAEWELLFDWCAGPPRS